MADSWDFDVVVVGAGNTALSAALASLARNYSHQAQNLKLKASFEALMAGR